MSCFVSSRPLLSFSPPTPCLCCTGCINPIWQNIFSALLPQAKSSICYVFCLIRLLSTKHWPASYAHTYTHCIPLRLDSHTYTNPIVSHSLQPAHSLALIIPILVLLLLLCPPSNDWLDICLSQYTCCHCNTSTGGPRITRTAHLCYVNPAASTRLSHVHTPQPRHCVSKNPPERGPFVLEDFSASSSTRFYRALACL